MLENDLFVFKVDMQIEDLKDEIQESHKELLGYSLYEYFIDGGKLAVKNLEKKTKCSLFFSPLNKLLNRSRCKVQVINGDIVDQSCDAIVDSTGNSMNFKSQVSKAIMDRYSIYPTLCETKRKGLAESKLYFIETENYLPWKFVFRIITPGNSLLLKEAIVMLLKEADKLPIKTLALPTIGTGDQCEYV